jgi:hypothetical protein
MELYVSLRLLLRSKTGQASGSLLRRFAPVSKGSRAAFDMTGFPLTSFGDSAIIAWASSQLLVAATR